MVIPVLLVILRITITYGIIQSDCPLGCTCDNNTSTVECNFYGYDGRLPNVPKTTEYVTIKEGNFGILESPQACSNYSKVKELSLINNKITSVEEDSFRCTQELQSLHIDFNLIRTVPNGTFKYLTKLQNISLKLNELDAAFLPKLCTIKSLEIVELRENFMILTPKDLQCFGFLRKLSYINLSYNFIQGPLSLALQPFKHVQNSLILERCNISYLTIDTFKNFRLQILHLSYNKIKHIEKDTFKTMTNLKELHLEETGVIVTQELFTGLSIERVNLNLNSLTKVPTLTKTMQEVYLQFNNFSTLTNGSFHNLDNMEELYLSYSNIRHIQKNVIHNLPKLRIIYLRENNINAISLENLILDLVKCPLLRVLDVSKNPLYNVTHVLQVFTPNRLEGLYLEHCKIANLQSGTFDNFKYLTELYLSNNFIDHLDPHVFKGLTRLTILQLNDNQLQSLDSVATGLSHSSLVILNVSNNAIDAISLVNITSLQTLDLSSNEMEYISSETFKNLTSLRHLNLSSTNIGNIENYTQLANLLTLDLSNNKLGECPVLPGTFWQMKNLTSLDLSGCQDMDTLPEKDQMKIWEKSYQLENLRISNCKLSMLFPAMFSTLTNLIFLDASNNRISHVEPEAFQNMTKLRELHLDGNSILYITWQSFAHLPNLRTLSTLGNPFVCSCEVLWLFQAVRTLDLVFVLKLDNLVCNTPLDVHNIVVRDLNLKVSDCEDRLLRVLAPVVSVISSMIAILVFYTLWHYRWHIRYTIFLARAGQGRYEELHDDQVYVNDAFVAYSGADLGWVKHQMLPNVDADYLGREGFKLCLHHRDWLVGVDIAENIVKSIAESRRTILVLSKEFAKSYWCRFELATAHMRLDAEGHRRSRLLVILLDEIPDQLLNARIIHILTSKTYIPWPKDPESQPHFWKTLHKSLRRDLLYNLPSDEHLQWRLRGSKQFAGFNMRGIHESWKMKECPPSLFRRISNVSYVAL